MIYLVYLVWGVAVGVIGGFLGIGGGVVIIPTLIYIFGLNQLQAQGTSLALMVPPIGFWAAYRYYQDGNVVMPIAVLGAIGFFAGGYLGAGMAHHVSPDILRRAFGVLLLFLGGKMLLG